MKKYIVNNQEVEYLRIEKGHDGTIKVEFEKKFNIITAHMSMIMERLRENNLNGCHVFKDEYHGIISILLKSIDQVHGVLHVLNVPHSCYEINHEDALIVIDIPVMENVLKMYEDVKEDEKCLMES